MSLLTSHMTPKMSTAYSGLSALIQAATSQLSDLAETSVSETNSPEGSPPLLSNPTTPTLDGAHLYLDGTSSWHRTGTGAATVTPVLTSIEGYGLGTSAKPYFPEVLMHLLANPANDDIVTFLPDGKYFAVRRLDFARELLRKHFQLTAFEDFLEEARGWGFIRVNGNTSDNCNGKSNTNNGNCNASSKRSGGTNKDDIYVFRHPHFEKNRPIDMSKMRSQTKTKTPIALAQNTNNEVNNVKRQLPPSTDNGDFEDNRQRLKIESKSLPVDSDPFLFSGITSDQPVQLRRRSSLELRGVAEAITASKIQLNSSSRDIINEDDNGDQDPTITYGTDGTSYPRNGSDHTSPKQERRQSTASSLVDGGVETATQNIVTDAIEALLFDEGHTRETYNRHEKELSISSLPGVVPISKQLFSANDNSNPTSSNTKSNNDETSEANNRKNNGSERKEIANKKPELPSSSSSSSPSSWVVQTTLDSLEDASRINASNSFSSNSDLQALISNDRIGAQQQRGSTDRSMVVSPARMEAAAALVSQSRNMSDGIEIKRFL